MQYIYLDYHASTPCDPRVVEAMLPYFTTTFANPSSTQHVAGRDAADAVARAREQVAAAIGAVPSQIVFTSGATESNNLAILGVGRARPSGRNRVLVSAIEHKCVLGAASMLNRESCEVVVIPVQRDGMLDCEAFERALDTTTALVSIQAANNEIGTIQPIQKLAEMTHAAGAMLHCDAAQALGRIPIDVEAWGVDLLSLSSHKAYGPKGVGALYVRQGPRRAQLAPLLAGGGQEAGLRPGTLNVPAIVGFGCAAELAVHGLVEETHRVAILRDELECQLLAALPGVQFNGSRTARLSGNSSVTIPGLEAEALIARMRRVALSTGSACTAGAPEPSHVLLAIGLSREQAYSTFRLGLGRFSTESDVADFVRLAAAAHKELVVAAASR